MRSPRPVLARLATSLAALVLVGACSSPSSPTPGPTDITPDRAAAELAAGLAKKDLTTVGFVGATGSDIDATFQPMVKGMGPLSPSVNVGSVTRNGTSATATLTVTWNFPGVTQPWLYSTQAQLQEDGGTWKTVWQPSILFPQLDGTNRLTQSRLYAARGEILGPEPDPIVTYRAVYRIGIDKTVIPAEQWHRSAVKLARLVKIDTHAYADKVVKAGAEAFVEALILRAGSPDLPTPSAIKAIPGARALEAERMLAPYREFARPVIGIVGDATKDIVSASAGAIVAGDQVGLSGIQKRYDGQLRGAPGAEVQLVPLAGGGSSPSPSPSPSGAAKPVTLFQVKPVDGKPLSVTLNVTLQEAAEKILAKTVPPSGLIAIKPSTGAILVAANGPGNKEQSYATVAESAPGSTFKVITALALLRSGMTPDSKVDCPRSVTVDGKTFTNYSDYPSSAYGTITLTEALAQSCNTAFVQAGQKLAPDDLLNAARSLGFSTDYSIGFSSYFGEIQPDDTATGRAAALIGQGKVTASPLAMAAVAASVEAGHTVVPYLLTDRTAKPRGPELTSDEAAQLRMMMRAVVTSGSGKLLDGLTPAVIAKTGTAEYGSGSPLPTHAWMIAAQGDLAVAVYVDDGKSGSGTAGPLLKAFLRAAG